MELRQVLKKYWDAFTANNYLFLGTIWFVWIFTGTLFYTYDTNFGWAKGFYMSVNVGYSIGWGYPVEPHHTNLWYSVFHLLVGSSAVAAALSFFASAMLEENKNWYDNARKKAMRENLMKSHRWDLRYSAYLEHYTDGMFPFFCWVGWIFMGSLWACEEFNWKASEGLYFAVSTCSTGGLWAIPSDSEDSSFWLVGWYAAIGVPMAAVAMATLAAKLMNSQQARVGEVEEMLNQPVTEKELAMMRRFGLEDGDGVVDKGEYVILCMARMGAVDPTIVEMITKRFKLLDTSGDGELSYAELMGSSGMSLAAGTAEGDSAAADARFAASLGAQDAPDTSTSNIMLKNVASVSGNAV